MVAQAITAFTRLAALTLLLFGCGRSSPTSETAPQLRSALACPYEHGAISLRCDGYKAWLAHLEAATTAPDPALLRLLDSPQEAQRWLAAASLLRRGRTYTADAALAGDLTAALTRERAPTVAALLASAAARIKTPTAGSALADLATSHPLSRARAALLGELAFHQRASWAVKLTAQRAALDPDPAVVRAAVAGLELVAAESPVTVCGALRRLAKTQAAAREALGRTPACRP